MLIDSQELWPQWYRQEFYGKYNKLCEKDSWNQLRPLACSAITLFCSILSGKLVS